MPGILRCHNFFFLLLHILTSKNKFYRVVIPCVVPALIKYEIAFSLSACVLVTKLRLLKRSKCLYDFQRIPFSVYTERQVEKKRSVQYVQESRMCWRMDEFKVDPRHTWKDWSAMLRYKRAKAGYKKEKKHIAGRVTCRLRGIRPYRGGLFCPGIPFNATHRESSPLHFSLSLSLVAIVSL